MHLSSTQNKIEYNVFSSLPGSLSQINLPSLDLSGANHSDGSNGSAVAHSDHFAETLFLLLSSGGRLTFLIGVRVCECACGCVCDACGLCARARAQQQHEPQARTAPPRDTNTYPHTRTPTYQQRPVDSRTRSSTSARSSWYHSKPMQAMVG